MVTGARVVTGDAANATFRITVGNSGQARAVAPGDVLGCRLPQRHVTVVVNGAENCTFHGITLFGGPSMAVLETGFGSPGLRGGNTYSALSVRYPDAPAGAPHRPPVSTSADGIHIARSGSGVTIRDCYLEGMHDDGIAIHGQYSVVLGADANTSTVMVASQYGATTSVTVCRSTTAQALPPCRRLLRPTTCPRCLASRRWACLPRTTRRPRLSAVACRSKAWLSKPGCCIRC